MAKFDHTSFYLNTYKDPEAKFLKIDLFVAKQTK